MKNRNYSVWERLMRLLRMKLIIPLLRSPHPPEYKARGVAVGLAWAMTPLVGIQMWAVFMTWLGAKKLFKWTFSLPLGLAWTWVTNVFTMIPCYYIFYVTGQLMRWDTENIGGYNKLSGIIRETFLSDLSFAQKWGLFLKLLVQDYGISMMIGCLPWLVGVSVAGYYLTLRFEQKRLARKQKKLLQKQENA